MKEAKLLMLFLIITLTTSAQNPAEIDLNFDIGTGLDGGTAYTRAKSFALQPDGKILVGGDFNSYNGNTKYKLIRLNTDGSIDQSFDIGNGFTNTEVVYKVILQSNGKILVGGDFTSYQGNTAYNNLVRLNTDGSLDTSFNSGGIGFQQEPRTNIRTILIQPDDKILIGGSLSSYNNIPPKEIIRLNSDGSIDTDFVGGNFSFGTSQRATIHTIALQADNKIIAGGNFTSLLGSTQNRLIRLKSNGLKDGSFNIGTGFNGRVFATAIQLDGKVLVGGLYSTYNGDVTKYLVRLNTDGSKDVNFDIGLGFQENNPVNAIKLQTDGKILVGGNFQSYNGNTQNGLIRLNSDGSKDTTFDIGLGFSVSFSSSGVDVITIQENKKILVGGAFGSYNNIVQNHIVRLYGDSVLSTDNFFIDETMVIYPNPALNFIHINGFELSTDKVTILNINGQIVKSLMIQDKKINVSDLKTGLYFVKIKNLLGKFLKK